MTLLGQEIIKATSKTLPNQPGVYQMQDDKGNILYIGKAKVLSNRVKNYLSLNNLTRRIQRMVSLTKSMNFFVTNTELEAIILECNLIKKHKPRFNVLLRDDKSFPLLYLFLQNMIFLELKNIVVHKQKKVDIMDHLQVQMQ